MFYVNGLIVIAFIATIAHLLYGNYLDLGSTDVEAWDSYYWYGFKGIVIPFLKSVLRYGWVRIFNV